MKIPWRKNVLWLMILAYAAVLTIFLGLIWKGATSSDAYEVIKEPLMALIGGTLALAKDLVPFGIEDPATQSGAGAAPAKNEGSDKKEQ